jgi:carbon-monoxide dehydrogenase small subunit
MEGKSIVTLEGVSLADRALFADAFAATGGLQCGFCTPGFLIAIYELLKDNPSPDDAEILDVLGGQICRCTGYQSILRAVHSAAAKLGAAGA